MGNLREAQPYRSESATDERRDTHGVEGAGRETARWTARVMANSVIRHGSTPWSA